MLARRPRPADRLQLPRPVRPPCQRRSRRTGPPAPEGVAGGRRRPGRTARAPPGVNALTEDAADGPRLVAAWSWPDEMLCSEADVRDLGETWFEALDGARRPCGPGRRRLAHHPVRPAAGHAAQARSSADANRGRRVDDDPTSGAADSEAAHSRTSCRCRPCRRACCSTPLRRAAARRSTRSRSPSTSTGRSTRGACGAAGRRPGPAPRNLRARLPPGRAPHRRCRSSGARWTCPGRELDLSDARPAEREAALDAARSTRTAPRGSTWPGRRWCASPWSGWRRTGTGWW